MDGLDEITITRALITRYFDKPSSHLECDVAIVGGGPSGLIAGCLTAGAGLIKGGLT